MRTRPVLTAGLLVAVAAGSFAPALAGAKPKPVTKTYSATAATPGGVTNVALGVCEGSTPGSTFDQPFKAPFKGRLHVHQDGFVGDWDLALQQDGANSAESAQQATDDPQTPEDVDGFKLKKGETVTIRSCNFSGGPTANVKYTFTAL